MEFWEVLANRHSTRDFRPDPIPRESLERIIHAATLAPSAMNAQPWRYHVAQGDARVAMGKIISQATLHLDEYLRQLEPEQYEFAIEWYSSLGNAPVLIAVSSPDVETEIDIINNLLSIGTSIENVLLAATAEGLASCNVTAAWWVREDLSEYLHLKDRMVIAVVVLGYPGSSEPLSPEHREDVAEWLE